MPTLFPSLFHDLRFALRQLRKTPVFTAIAVLTLALGIGANTAVFGVMNAVLLRSLPVERPDGLFYVRMGRDEIMPPGAGNTGDGNTSFSLPVFTALRGRTDVFDSLIAFAPLAIGETAARVGAEPVTTEGEEVSGNFFSGLSAGLALGRGLTPADEQGHAPVMVVSYAFWTRQFARNPGVLGRTVFVKGVPFTVVGVAARGFFGVEPAASTDFWVPLQTRAELNAWGVTGGNTLYGTPKWWCLRMIARLRPGVTPGQARAALAGTFLDAAKAGIGTIDPKEWKPLLAFEPARGIAGYSEQYRQPVAIVMGLVLLVLLIAVTNVALMLVARNAARAREFSLRLALGAGRGRLLRQLLVESGVLVAAGAALGWLFAVNATELLARMAQIESGLAPDGAVLWFTLGVSVLAALAFGLAPLRAAVRAPVAGVLRAGAASVTENRRGRLAGNAVMAAQVAVCLLLLVAASLLLRTLERYRGQPLGMAADKLLVFGVTPQGGDARAFYRVLVDRLSALPGVEGVTLVGERPGSGWSDNNDLAVDGVDRRGHSVRSNIVGAEYFRTVGTRLIAGREFVEADTGSKEITTVVNETLARRYFAHGRAVSHHVGSGGMQARIIGVVADSRYTSVDEPPTPMAYVDAWQIPNLGAMTVEVRTKSDPLALLPEVREALRRVDPNVPLADPMTQAEQFALSYAQPAMFATLGGFFGGLAALLAGAGLYGTLAYRTARRRTEIGVRMALGAQRGQVVWLVLRESLVFAGLGLAAGLPLTLLSVRGLRALLWQLSPYDPVSLAVGVAGVLVVLATASVVPARRAASVDPAESVRAE